MSLSSTQFGGGEVYLLNLLSHFRKQYDVFVAAAAENRKMITRLEEINVPFQVVSLRYSALWRTVTQVVAWHAQEGFGLVHANGRRSQLFGALLAARTGLPLLAVDHLAPLTLSGPRAAAVRNLVAALLNRVVADPWIKRRVVICDFMLRESIQRLRMSPEKLVRVYNAVDPEVFAPRPRDEHLAASLGISPDSPVIVCSGRLVEHKGQRQLLQALKLLRRPDVKLLLIGNGPDEAFLRAQVSASALEEQVIFMNFPPDIRPYMALANVGVLNSREEGLPTALLQLCSMQKPVVGTDTQGIPEIIEHGINGYLVPLQRPDVLADALGRVLKDPELAQTLGRNGRLRVLRLFTVQAMFAAYEQLYAQELRDNC